MERAREAYRTLALFLGDKQYFFGTSHPTVLDAIVYAHLAVHAVQLPTPSLSNTLSNEFPVLQNFVRRFGERHTRDLVSYQRPVGRSIGWRGVWTAVQQVWESRTESEAPVSWTDYLSVGGAVLGFVGYVWWKGLVVIEVGDKVEEEDEEEEYE